jgi:small subunit ribosomal protein S14
MASTRMIARQHQMKKIQEHAKRKLLRDVINSPESEADDVYVSVVKLQKRKRDESPVRFVRRCEKCGRPKGVYRYFGLCRCCLRKYATLGIIPGLIKL